MGIPASLLHPQITNCCGQALDETLQSSDTLNKTEGYVTSKQGKDAPSAPVLEGLAASLIHSLQLHC